MKYHICFAADEHEPYPPLAEMVTVDATTPLDAVKALVGAGRVPLDRTYNWARVVIESVDGRPKRALRFPISPEVEVPLDWNKPE